MKKYLYAGLALAAMFGLVASATWATTTNTVTGGCPTSQWVNAVNVNSIVQGCAQITMSDLGVSGGGLTVAQGGTGVATLTAHGLLVGEGTAAVAALPAGTSNQVPISGGASADPSYSNAMLAPNVTSGVDQVTVLGGVTGTPGVVGVQATGTDSNISAQVVAKGTGGVFIGGSTTNTANGLQVATPAGAIVNQLVVTPAVTGTVPSLTTTGDANRNLNVQGAGTGLVTLGTSGGTGGLSCAVTGTTPQICNGQRGIVTTGTLTTAAVTDATFTITNSSVATTSLVLCTIQAYSGTYSTNGDPIVLSCVPGSGSFVVNFRNVHATNALNGTLQFGFLVAN